MTDVRLVCDGGTVSDPAGDPAPGTRCRFPDDKALYFECGRPAWGLHPADKHAYCWDHYVRVDQAVTS